MRVVFFGTPDFAVVSLKAMLRERISVVGVVTQPDKPQGRSRTTLVPPPVKVVAQAEGLPILQPTRPVGDLFLAAVRRLEPDLGVVVAYGHVLRREVLDLPPRGLINVHASLLPRFRGAAPIQHALMEGVPETGVSIMQLDEGMDTGPVLYQLACPVAADDTAGTLSRRLATLGATALIEAISLLSAGLERPQPQDDSAATYAPKVSRELARLDWTRDAQTLERQVRAFDPAPGAWTTLDAAPVKLFAATPAVGSGTPGSVLAATDRLVIACGNGALAVREVQPAGKTRLAVGDWVRGRGISAGRQFE